MRRVVLESQLYSTAMFSYMNARASLLGRHDIDLPEATKSIKQLYTRGVDVLQSKPLDASVKAQDSVDAQRTALIEAWRRLQAEERRTNEEYGEYEEEQGVQDVEQQEPTPEV